MQRSRAQLLLYIHANQHRQTSTHSVPVAVKLMPAVQMSNMMLMKKHSLVGLSSNGHMACCGSGRLHVFLAWQCDSWLYLVYDCASKDGACLMGFWMVFGGCNGVLGFVAVLTHLSCL